MNPSLALLSLPEQPEAVQAESLLRLPSLRALAQPAALAPLLLAQLVQARGIAGAAGVADPRRLGAALSRAVASRLLAAVGGAHLPLLVV